MNIPDRYSLACITHLILLSIPGISIVRKLSLSGIMHWDLLSGQGEVDNKPKQLPPPIHNHCLDPSNEIRLPGPTETTQPLS